MWGGRGNPKTEAGAGQKEIRTTKYAEGKNPERGEGNNLVFSLLRALRDESCGKNRKAATGS
jgi:hypothetical protein